MTNISHNLAGKIDKETVAILFEIEEITSRLKLPYFIVGATARDILLQHAYGIRTTRATVDIDIAVTVSDWAQFENLKTNLAASGKFDQTRQPQRLMYKDVFPIDIIPFGSIALEDGSVTWPPEHDIEMSLLGFQECYKHSIYVQISANPDLIVKVVGLAGLAIMKIISWDENIERRGKDAADLMIIIENFIEAGNTERFFETGYEILQEENSDYDQSSARFLGREIAKMAAPATKNKLIEILKREADSAQGHKLAMDVLRQKALQNETYDTIASYFNTLLKGISE